MPCTMRQLSWAARARQRSEWDRFAVLLSLVDSRTIFDSKTKPVPFTQWYPSGMLTREEMKLAARTKPSSKVPSLPLSAVIDALVPKRST